MIIPVILAGGSGTRLWPMSRALMPKQFFPLTDNLTMLQNTAQRMRGFEGAGPPIVICNQSHGFIVAGQLQEIGVAPPAIFLEPVGRNTAPAVAVAALKAASIDPDALILVLPADHLIADLDKFHHALRLAEKSARSGGLVTFGIIPDRPETGYGYIRKGEAAESEGVFSIAEFVEKPDLNTAVKYLASGEYCWNSGMFLFNANRVIDELSRHVPDIMAAARDAFEKGRAHAPFFYLDKDAFDACPSDSIDYAVMEKTDQGMMVPFEAGWDDVGSWEALWKVGEKDASGNVIRGDAVINDVSDTLVYADSRLVAMTGVSRLAVIETTDAVLICSLDKSQGVKQVVDLLKEKGRPECRTHARTLYDWGTIEALETGPELILRKITLHPETALTVKGHPYPALHWMVVSGRAVLREDGRDRSADAGDALNILPRQRLTCTNLQKEPLIILEVIRGAVAEADHLAQDEAKSGHDARG